MSQSTIAALQQAQRIARLLALAERAETCLQLYDEATSGLASDPIMYQARALGRATMLDLQAEIVGGGR